MSLGPPPVLVVEDDPDDVFLIRRAFEKSGAQNPLAIAEDADQAISYLSGSGEYADRKKHPFPALLLLDLKLPRIAGFDVLAWVRKQPKLGRLVVVVLTSSREAVDIDRAYDLGANSYIVKPVSFDELAKTLTAVGHYWLSLNTRPHTEP